MALAPPRASDAAASPGVTPGAQPPGDGALAVMSRLSRRPRVYALSGRDRGALAAALGAAAGGKLGIRITGACA